jgi:hypothetical protein
VNEDITVAELRAAKDTLERKLASMIYAAVQEFHTTTGVTPSGIQVSMSEVTSATSVGKRWVVTDVVTDIHL